jgi:hypothetical protein
MFFVSLPFTVFGIANAKAFAPIRLAAGGTYI